LKQLRDPQITPGSAGLEGGRLCFYAFLPGSTVCRFHQSFFRVYPVSPTVKGENLEHYNLNPDDFPNTERIWQGPVSLPIYADLSDSEMKYVADTIQFFGKITNRKAIWLVALLVIVGGVFWFHEVLGKQTGESFTAMTFNVGTFNAETPDMIRIRELISRTGIPDVLLLQEVPGKKQASFLADNLKFQSCVFEYYPSGKDGLAALSKHPLKKLKTFYFDGYASIAAEADIEGKKVLLLSVHLERVEGVRVTETAIELPWKTAFKLFANEIAQETPRSRAVGEILSWISLQPYKNIIIAGDFNTIPFSKAIRKMGKIYDDALWPSVDYLTGSYNKLSLPIKPSID